MSPASTAIESGAVQHLLPDWEAAGIAIHLVSPPERRQVRAFAEHVAHALTRSSR